ADGQRRQAQGQGGVEPGLRLQLRGETGDDRGDQRAKGGEQAGVYPVTPGPAGVEGGGKPFLQLVVQGPVVEDSEPVMELLFACTAMFGQGHWTASFTGPRNAAHRGVP